MKTRTLLAWALIAGSLAPQFARAQATEPEYQMHWHGISYTGGAGGQIVTKPFSEKDIIQQVATDNGLDPAGLLFVYRVDSRDTVVTMPDGTFIADVIQLQYNFTDVTNSTGTMGFRYAQLNDENHSDPIGSAFGTQHSTLDAQGVPTHFTFSGKFQYAFPDTDTIYVGNFSTGKPVGNFTGTGGGGGGGDTNAPASAVR